MTLLLREGMPGRPTSAERRFATLVERLPAIVFEAEPGPEGLWLYVSGFVETLLGYTPRSGAPTLGYMRAASTRRTAISCSQPRSG